MFFGNDVTQDSQLPFLPLLKCFIAFSDSPGIRKEQANEYPDNAKNGNDYSNDKPCKCNDCNQPCLHRAALISIVSSLIGLVRCLSWYQRTRSPVLLSFPISTPSAPPCTASTFSVVGVFP